MLNQLKNKIISVIEKMLGKNNISTIIIYGSRVTGTNKDNSDFDLFITTYGTHQIIGRIQLDNLLLEYHTIPVAEINNISPDDIQKNLDRSLYSILTTGEIIYRNDDTYIIDDIIEQLKMTATRKRNKKNSHKNNNIALEWYYKYQNTSNKNPNVKSYIYYNLIESIRRFDSDENSYDSIPVFKFFELIENEIKRKNYCIERIPNKEYLNMMKRAIEKENINDPYIQKLNRNENYQNKEEREFASRENIKHKMVIIKNAIERVQSSIGTFYYKYYYYVLLEKIRYLYMLIKEEPPNILDFDFNRQDEFGNIFLKCINNSNISSLKELFAIILKQDDIDFNNYKIKLNKQ